MVFADDNATLLKPAATPSANVTPDAAKHLTFTAYDGDASHPNEMAFQLSTLEPRRSTSFLKLGETVPGTNLKLQKFTADNQAARDNSALTVVDTRTHQELVLPIGKVVKIP